MAQKRYGVDQIVPMLRRADVVRLFATYPEVLARCYFNVREFHYRNQTVLLGRSVGL
jgi:hypothetical protein